MSQLRLCAVAKLRRRNGVKIERGTTALAWSSSSNVHVYMYRAFTYWCRVNSSVPHQYTHWPYGPRRQESVFKTFLTLAEVAELRVYTGWARVCQVLAPTICGGRKEGERQRVSPAVLAARRGVVFQQQPHILPSHQPGVRPEDPQQAAYTQTLHTLPPVVQVAPDGCKRVPRHQAPLSMPAHV